MTKNFDAILDFNKAAIFAEMNRRKIEAITVEYTGSGDSGDEFDVYATPDASLQKGQVQTKHYVYSYSSGTYSESSASGTLLQAVERVCDDLISEYHRGYENNEGGGGTITFLAEESVIDWDHYDNIVTEDHTAHKL